MEEFTFHYHDMTEEELAKEFKAAQLVMHKYQDNLAIYDKQATRADMYIVEKYITDSSTHDRRKMLGLE